jgi:phosphoribosylglycinamide formyltransferase 1
MIKLAIFASGSGTNAQRIASYFSNNKNVKIELILSNRKDAYVIERAKNLNLQYLIFNRHDFYDTGIILKELQEREIDFVVLAGFLWLVPTPIIQAFPNKIVNIHPALLPAYGGKGMFGEHVHQAVIANQEKVSGITIHYVNEKYDDGDIIFQAKCEIEPSDTPESLAQKIHQLEYEHFPKVIEKLIFPEV